MANFNDNDFFLQSAADNTKRMRFICSSLAAGQFAEITIPDPGFGASYAGTLGLLETTNIWTSPQTINNSQLTVNGAYIKFGDTSPPVNSVVLTVDGAGGYPSANRTVYLPDATGVLPVFNNTGGNGSQPLAGTMLYGAGATSAMSLLSIGSEGTMLVSSGSAPQWASVVCHDGDVLTYDDEIIYS